MRSRCGKGYTGETVRVSARGACRQKSTGSIAMFHIPLFKIHITRRRFTVKFVSFVLVKSRSEWYNKLVVSLDTEHALTQDYCFFGGRNNGST